MTLQKSKSYKYQNVFFLFRNEKMDLKRPIESTIEADIAKRIRLASGKLSIFILFECHVHNKILIVKIFKVLYFHRKYLTVIKTVKHF